mmetsp:Transcript_5115/g.16087  ORF Transcript_5115/g.16087 Transcript_5115/m.16087 type:complete len:83 (+) Transcript_5115:996-1244(+)
MTLPRCNPPKRVSGATVASWPPPPPPLERAIDGDDLRTSFLPYCVSVVYYERSKKKSEIPPAAVARPTSSRIVSEVNFVKGI